MHPPEASCWFEDLFQGGVETGETLWGHFDPLGAEGGEAREGSMRDKNE